MCFKFLCEILSISGAVTLCICPRGVVIDYMRPHSCLRDLSPRGDCLSVINMVLLWMGHQHDRWLGTIGTDAE